MGCAGPGNALTSRKIGIASTAITTISWNPRKDFVFCTHMHVDHVGWNTRLDNGRWVPTFPNAKYLFHRKEWEHWQDTQDEYQAPVVKDSLLPVVDAGLAEIVDADYVIEDGIRLLPTPGCQ